MNGYVEMCSLPLVTTCLVMIASKKLSKSALSGLPNSAMQNGRCFNSQSVKQRRMNKSWYSLCSCQGSIDAGVKKWWSSLTITLFQVRYPDEQHGLSGCSSNSATVDVREHFFNLLIQIRTRLDSRNLIHYLDLLPCFLRQRIMHWTIKGTSKKAFLVCKFNRTQSKQGRRYIRLFCK